MTPFQVCAEFSQHEQNLQADIHAELEKKRLLRQREIFEEVCFRQGIKPERLGSVPLPDLVQYVRDVCGSKVDPALLASGVAEFLAGK